MHDGIQSAELVVSLKLYRYYYVLSNLNQVLPVTCVQAWALFKGKFREGIDKPDPPTWKTRLRCALNKSNDFEELVERSQLDISDPYKVYRIVPEGAKKSQSHIKYDIYPNTLI